MSTFFFDNGKEVYPATPEEFERHTGARYTEVMVGEAPHEILNPPQNEWEISQKYLTPLYTLKRPSLVVKLGEKSGMHALYPFERIDKGVIVTEYLGDYQPKGGSPSPYRFGPINGDTVRSLAGLVEDGFPNLRAFYLYNYDKYPLRVLFVSLEPIEKGEPLLINYGPSHSIKIGHRKEYALDKMSNFFQQNPLNTLFSQLHSQQDLLTHEAHVTKLQYLFHTPSALKELLSLGIIPKKEAKTHFEKIDNRFYILGFYARKNKIQEAVEEEIRALL